MADSADAPTEECFGHVLGLLGGLALLGSVSILAVLAHRLLLQHRAVLRLGHDEAASSGGAVFAEEGAVREPIRWRPEDLSPRIAVALAAILGAVGTLSLRFGLGERIPWPIAIALGFDLAVLLWLWLASRRVRHLARLEAQLAETLRLAAAALRAGLGRIDAFHRAAEQVDAPLKPLLLEAVGRLRLGESPLSAFERLSERVPLETFRLFSMIIATQWHAGGSLQGTLASVGDFMQDRVDVQQRIASQSAPTRSSTLVLFAATAAIAYFSWSNDPFNLERFLTSQAGALLVGTTLGLQGVALLWMDRLMRSRL